MRTNVLDTSIDAFYSIPNRSKEQQSQRIISIVRSAVDMSLREIAQAYNTKFAPAKIETSSVSARCNELVSAGVLARSTPIRKCSLSHKSVHPVSFVPAQGSLI